MLKMYGGIGARSTPTDILIIMNSTARLLATDGHCCNTGAAKGADQAFAEGAAEGNGQVQLMLPWASYEQDWVKGLGGPGFYPDVLIINKIMNAQAFMSVDMFHPAPDNLTDAVKKLHARNHMIISGVKFIICWTPGGEVVGGTGQALRIAASMGIPVYNLGVPDTLVAFKEKITERMMAEDVPF